MAKTGKKAPKLSEEELTKLGLERSLEEIRKRINTGRVPKNITRLFKVGDQVQLGAWGTTHVTEVLDEGLIYKLHADYMGTSYGNPVRIVQDSYFDWTHVFPYRSQEENSKIEIFVPKNDIFISFKNSSLDSLLHYVYHAGVDFNPDYQRDLVWTSEQKVSLINSIFNHIDIGKFTFIKHDYSRDLFLEILDGKQRLTTICEFYEDRFTYRGKKFSELSVRDQNHFTGFPIVYGETENLTQKQIYGLFLRMNTAGQPVSEAHLEKVRQLYLTA
jgi:uncharacterized protein with ParB-like and HNH nuclease domain